MGYPSLWNRKYLIMNVCSLVFFMALFSGCDKFADFCGKEKFSASQISAKDSATVLEQNNYLEHLTSLEDFHSLSATIDQKEHVKYLIDTKNNRLYFQNTKTYPFHLNFVRENIKEYENISDEVFEDFLFGQDKKIFSSGAIYYFPQITIQGNSYSDLLIFTLYYRGTLTLQEIKNSFNMLKSHIPFAKSMLFVFEDSDMAKAMRPQLSESNIDSCMYTDLETRTSIVYNSAKSYGYLRAISRRDFEQGNYTSKDILILDRFLPLDIGPVSGIISTSLQTPHSHVVLRTINQNIPNIYSPTVLENTEVQKNLNQLVEFHALPDGTWSLKNESAFASGELANLATKYFKNRVPTLPKAVYDLTNSALLSINDATYSDAEHKSYGAKGSYFHLLNQTLKANGIDRSRFNGALLIPFNYYKQHIAQNITAETCNEKKIKKLNMQETCLDAAKRGLTIEALIKEITVDKKLGDLLSQTELRKKTLSLFAALIEQAPLAQDFESTLLTTLQKSFATTERIRFRSSSNAEDLPGISGAGIYESKSGCLGDSLQGSGEEPSKCVTELEIQRIQKRIDVLSKLPYTNDDINILIDDFKNKLKQNYPIKKAVKKVWASMWTEKAFLHRDYYGIPHDETFMGILVHPSFQDEKANGVAIIERKSSGLNISAVLQSEDLSITNPEIPNLIPEQVNLTTNSKGDLTAQEVVSYSNYLLPGNRVLGDAKNYAELAKQIAILTSNAFHKVKTYDLEFIMDPKKGITIKQIRPLAKILPVPEDIQVSLSGVTEGSFTYKTHRHGWNSYTMTTPNFTFAFETPQGDDDNPSRNTTKFGWRAFLRFNQFSIADASAQSIYKGGVFIDQLTAPYPQNYYCKAIPAYLDANPTSDSFMLLTDVLRYFWKTETMNDTENMSKYANVRIPKPENLDTGTTTSYVQDMICYFSLNGREGAAKIKGLSSVVLHIPLQIRAPGSTAPRSGSTEPKETVSMFYTENGTDSVKLIGLKRK